MRVLIVDDSKAMRSIIGRIVKELGFEVLEAGDGRLALAQLEGAGSVDLCLVDWNMPVMNGIEFVEAVRGKHAWDPVKLMMITTASDVEHVRRALEAGANEYLMKPFTKEMIAEKLAMFGMGSN
ncbi:MAG: response regulator [Candidatus Binataceae bacterium]